MTKETAFYVSLVISLLFSITMVNGIHARVTTNHVDSLSATTNQGLEVTATTNKQQYCAYETVQVYGNLTLAGVSVTDGLVGLQITSPPQNETLITRTLSTGNPPSETPYVFIEYVVPCDQNGDPRFSFQRGTLALFKTSVVNLDIEPRDALMTVNIYYSENVPFGHASLQATISAQSNPSFIIGVPIPEDATLGTATVYADAYTDWPRLAGTPYCSEVNSTFQITSTTSLTSQAAQNPLPTIQQTDPTVNYNSTFRLARNTPTGNYTVYVSSRYQGESASNSTTFEAYRLGDLGGGVPPQFLLFDGAVDGKDLALFLQCFKGTAPPEAMYLGDLGGGVPPQFFQFDGKVDGKDLALFLQCYKGIGP